jgi:hypothetical protein
MEAETGMVTGRAFCYSGIKMARADGELPGWLPELLCRRKMCGRFF